MRTVLATLLLLAAAPACAATVVKFDVPGAKNTRVTAVSAAGFVAGNYDPSGAKPCTSQCGFRSPDGTITPFSVIDATIVEAAAVDNPGVVVDQYLTADFQRHAYIRFDIADSGEGLGGTQVGGIAASGMVAGNYSDDGLTSHGYVRVP